MIGPFADIMRQSRDNDVHVTQLIVSDDGKNTLLSRKDRAARVPIYVRTTTTQYDPLQKARTT